MSLLIDALKKVDRAASQPIGFRTARTTDSEPRILLIASLEPGAISQMADNITNADAILLCSAKSRLTVKSIQETVSSLPDIPWGLFLEDIGAGKASILIEAGCDFVILAANSPVTITPQDEKIGIIIQVESTLDDSSLRAINNLTVDAIVAADVYQGNVSMSWHQLINVQRLANLLTKPLLVTVPLGITDSELKAIWEAGVDGVIVDVDTSKSQGLQELRGIIGKLPPRSARKRDKAEALLPYSGSVKEPEPEEDYEEDE